MSNFKFLGTKKSLNNPEKIIYETEQSVLDYFGRIRTIPAGVEVKHFETTNKGWLVWKDKTGLHITDLA